MRPAAQWLLAAALLQATACAHADEGDAASSPRYKLSIGAYRTNAPLSALDLNLRVNRGPHTGWIAYYADSRHFDQPRAGYEYNIDAALLRATLSAQWASGGFFGGSISGELGPPTLFAIAGFGRTDTHDYVNLNFDPNDMVQFGAGFKPHAPGSLSLYRIQDDRLHTQQRVTHGIYKYHLASGRDLVLDLFYKSGLVDDGSGPRVRHGTGATLTYDLDRTFVRFAYDPYVNFSAARMLRFTTGLRF